MTALPEVDALAARIHQTAVDHGFWDKPRNLGEMLMLVCSELAECLEEDREHNPLIYFQCTECGYRALNLREELAAWGHYKPDTQGKPCLNNHALKPEGALVEVADAIIRLFDTGHDMASRTRYTLSEVMLIKMDYNDTRSHMHGKRY